MSRNMYMRFPGGKAKALTLSYDDGVEQDIRLIDILDKHGIKATFNINSGCYSPEDKVFKPGQVHRRMPKSRCTEVYNKNGHEVAVHAYTHPFLEKLPASGVAYEIVKDREILEEQFGCIVRGMAYPYGTYNDTVVEVLRECGVVYSRTTKTTEKFTVPTDWLRLDPTCHHKNPRLMELAEKFVADEPNRAPELFYLWGHSYEFEGDDNWNVIEEFAEYIGGKEDIWYANNIEIYDYVKAYESLICSVDMNMVTNPSAKTVWVFKNKQTYEIAPGETVKLD